MGRLLKRYRGKVNEVCTSKLPPPTIIKTFATYFSDKVADELNLKDLVGNMNDEIQSNGGERKEETARCLDILTEDLIMGTLEVTDLCNQYFKEELRRCDKHWQDQQSWLRKIYTHSLPSLIHTGTVRVPPPFKGGEYRIYEQKSKQNERMGK